MYFLTYRYLILESTDRRNSKK